MSAPFALQIPESRPHDLTEDNIREGMRQANLSAQEAGEFADAAYAIVRQFRSAKAAGDKAK